jgi:iron complex transport system substrate-binding protein
VYFGKEGRAIMIGIGRLLKTGSLVVVLVAGVCSQGSCFPVTAKDDRGKEIELKERPRRIVSLVPTQTELLFSLGLGKEVVGVTNYCNYPDAAKQKEKIGGFAEIDIEKIRALKPDLVLSFGTIQLPATEKLEKIGLKVFWMYPHTVNDILVSMERVGEITGTRREATHVRESMEKDIRALREALGTIPDDKRPTVFRVMGLDPPATIGAESFQSDVFYLAGGKNAFADVKKDYFQVDARELAKRNPDLIVMCGADEAESKQRLKDSLDFKDLAAVKNDAIVIISCDLTCRPGPRVAETAARIARILHREKFSGKR